MTCINCKSLYGHQVWCPDMISNIPLKYVRPTSLDHPAVGDLRAARSNKKRALSHLRHLRDCLKREPMSGNRAALRLQILKSQGLVHEWKRAEWGALRAIEARAQELGCTTIRSLASPGDQHSTKEK